MDARKKAEALVELERNDSARVICDLMRTWGLRLQPGHVPEALNKELMRFGYAVLDIGNDYAHDKDTIPHAIPDEPPTGAFGTPPRPPSVPRHPAIEPKQHPRDRSKR